MAHVNFLMATAVCRNRPEGLHAARKVTFFFPWQRKKEAPSAQSAHTAVAVSDVDTFDVLKAVAIASFSIDATAHPWDVSQTALSWYFHAKILRKIILTPYIPSKYRTTDLG